MSFFNQHLEFKDNFDKNFNQALPKLKSILSEMLKKFYALYQNDKIVHFLNIDNEILKFFDTNFMTLSKFVKEINPFYCEALTIDLTQEGQMIISSSDVVFKNRDSNFIFFRQHIPSFKIYIKSKYEIFIGRNYNGKFNFYEASLSDVSRICKNSPIIHEFFNIYFAYLVRSNLHLKDIQLDLLNNPTIIKSPFKFSLLENFVNKKEFFVTKYPKEVFLNSVNKHSLFATYIILKIKKYIPKPYLEDIINFISKADLEKITDSKGISLAKDVLYKYLCSKIASNKENYKSVIRDYVDMALEQKEEVNLKIRSLKRIEAEHDRLVLNIEEKYLPDVKINADNPFLRLKFPDDIKMLTTKQEIVEEGVANRNCVATYINQVNAKESFICSLRKNNRRYTIEVKLQRNKFYLSQISGISNSPAPNEVIEYVNSAILANNKTVKQIR
ncbi:PcfJ domain-containing protein [Campylobacter sp. MOP7]|uniref:PcfJ domain-containing protein n=1 Tax=Campylobacter canis TaxID=3378588 RepID=UPI00387E94B2